MATGLVIFIFLIGSLGPMVGEQSPRPGFFLVLIATLVVAAWVLFAVLASRLEKTGRTRHIVRAERLLSVSRAAVVGMHSYGVFALGWSESARAAVRGLPVIDDLAVAAPALLALVLLYAGYAPIQKRLREAVLFRFLHQGRPIGRALTRWQLVWEHVRHSILLALVPLVLLRVWIEAGSLSARGLGLAGDAAGWAELAWQVAGVFVVLAFSPWMLRFVWDTVPLEGGELRDRVERVLARNRVSARNVLVWQTSSGILNGALMGVVPMARYVLFTDALLQLLPVRQVEAVAAHEAGHGRLRHLPWLLGSMMTAALLFAMAFEVLARAWELPQTVEWSLVGVATSVLGAVLTLGFVSRRFELQADAFAVADLSRNPEPLVTEEFGVSPSAASDAVTAESVAAMNAALGAVSELNGVPRERFTWRHGTIAGRQEHLDGLVGVSLEALPIDRVVRWIKRATLLGVALAVGLIVIMSALPA